MVGKLARYVRRNHLGLLALFFALGGSSYAAVGLTSSPKIIHGCRNKATGALRIVAKAGTCESNEAALSWNKQGPVGKVGPTGKQGSTGLTGPTGPTGSAGPAGAAGANGTNGADGARGASGPSGPAGPAGAAGANGTNGTNGTDGARGASGPSGPAGSTGAAGPSGPAGSTGAAGPSGPTGATGQSGPSGATGPSGPSGATGPAGDAANIIVGNKELTESAPGFTSILSISVPSTSGTGGPITAGAGGTMNYTIVATSVDGQSVVETGTIFWAATSNSITCNVQTNSTIHLGTVNSGCTPGFFNPGSQPGISIFDNVSFGTPSAVATNHVWFTITNNSGDAIRLEP